MTHARLAIVGAGHLGKIHARLASSSGHWRVVAVVDPVISAGEALAREYGVVWVSSIHELPRDIDAAIVASPTQVHAESAVPLLARGIPVFIEKPLAASVNDAVEIVDAARRSGAVVQVGHVERFNPAWIAFESRGAGATYFESNRAAPHALRSTDIGVIHDLMIHDLDLVLSLCTSPIRRIDAHAVTVLGPHEDIAHARIEFSDNRVALLRASRVSPRAERVMEAYLENEHARLDFTAPSLTITGRCDAIRRGEFDVDTLTGAERDRCKAELFTAVLPTTSLTLEARNAIADEQVEFFHSIREGTTPRVNGLQGLRVVRVAAQILEAVAATQGPRRVVRGPSAASEFRRAG